MSQKLALIVDDSRSARSVLARMLERHGLDVDTAESAEDAISYLAKHRPDVIFMDHLMPGMDGLQAVQAIKNDPRTATIPILMYTSQAGDVYLSQARALGAVGVLPKQTRIADVSKALEQLHLIAAGTVPADTRAPADSGTGAAAAASALRLAALPPELRAPIEALLAEQVVELRRIVVERLNDQAQRIVGEVRLLMHDVAPPPGGALPVITATPLAAPAGESAPPAPASASVRPASRLPWLAAAVAVLLAVLLGVLWWREQDGQRALAAQLAAARAAAAAAEQRAQSVQPAPRAPTQLVPGGVVFVEPVPYGEAALSGARVEHLQGLLDRLVAQGFRGSVQVTSFAGRYCLSGSGDALALAAEDTPAAKCDQIASPPDSAAPVQHQSLAFANMIATERRASGGALDVQLFAGGVAEVAQAYPPPSDTLTAGQWNRAAAANNRVEARLVPDVTAPVASAPPTSLPTVTPAPADAAALAPAPAAGAANP